MDINTGLVIGILGIFFLSQSEIISSFQPGGKVKTQSRAVTNNSPKLSKLTRSFSAVLIAGIGLSACSTSGNPGTSSSPSTTSPAGKIRAGLGQYGFSKISAAKTVPANTAETITVGNLKVSIPSNAITREVTFQILQAPNSYWQKSVPAGKNVVANFAFRVINPRNKQLLTQFNAPITVSITSSSISSTSQYLNVTAAKPPVISPNPVPASIKGHTLTHANKNATTGWIVTS